MPKGLTDLLAQAINDIYWTDERVGKYGEKLTERKLNLINLFGRKGKTLKNIYIPKDNGETSEIDLVYITAKGIFVLESKNYSGWIFGDAESHYWTSCVPNKTKNRFCNPLKQNCTHIKWLSSYMSQFSSIRIPMYSVIVFSERCELKKVPDDSKAVIICKRDSLYRKIRKIWDTLPDTFSERDIEATYNILIRLTNVSDAQKQAHIDSINKRAHRNTPPEKNAVPISPVNNSAQQTAASNASAPQNTAPPVCPRCGSPLVLRTAKKGANAGNQFYGCSNFPKCRYTNNIENRKDTP